MNSDLHIVKNAATEAGGVILNYYKADYEIQEKSYHNLVTTADHAADSLLKEILMDAMIATISGISAAMKNTG